MKTKHKSQKNRNQFLKLMLGVLLAVFLVFALRLGQLMIFGQVNHQDLRENALALHERSSTLQAKRGTIYDIGGNPIAMDATSYSLLAVLTDQWTDPDGPANHVEDKEKTAEVLSQHINLSKEEILEILQTPDVSQVEFGSAGQNLSYAKMKEIEAENLQGITFNETPTRLYPNGVFASHLIGYASFKNAQDNDESRLAGQLGLELAKDDTLKGKNGKQSVTTNHDDYTVDGNQVIEAPVDGQDLYTSLDSRLQTYLESLLTNAYDRYQPETMTAMLVEPNTGKIVAASQRPTFNAQSKEGLDDMWQNLLVERAFEPGSTIKVLTLAAAIEEGVFNPNATYQSGAISIGNQTIRDYNKVGWGVISELEGLAHSSNVLMVELVGKIGYDKWEQYMYEFGLLQKPNSGFANEVTGSMNYSYEFEKASTSFGQGIYVSPWQMMQAFTAIANDGKMMALQSIDRYEDESGNLVSQAAEEKGQPISAETAHKTLEYLSQAMEIPNSTTGGYQIDGRDIAVKTGTAEIYDPDAGQYMQGSFDYLFSVVGFAPVDDPQYILYLTIERPQSNTSDGSQAMLADIFIPLMTRALDYGELATQSGYETGQVPDLTGQNKNSAQQLLSEQGFIGGQVLGDGNQIIDQVPKPGSEYSLGAPVYLLTDGQQSVPDFTGLDLTTAKSLADMLGINLVTEGDGLVVAQSVSAGSSLETGDEVVVQLQES
ncbi:penicillin-binding transpeptidase domain-containing protein [Aerococcus kribbianus]|uniref:Penicillin-binding transpeptidase domain-containing protein n=1 Tax=Aerococcus kribbianus TaxID=2999064 RepID=A0A9X3FNT6_9LACT|nr:MULTISPECIES: penicillin-binding transpeptidase domain-containing protein [unclassified Aerococcus]MCZ0717714.1 penicillin-binding transpeptidase domain-containing protein [Aerococcus sp. YH-aer221]MCZ0726002.1 penicillin-binding transpeptidase domain-containing protein [Aerococcus sp. YH-aer222]